MISVFRQQERGYLEESILEIPEIWRMNLPFDIKNHEVMVIGQYGKIVLVKFFDSRYGVKILGHSGFLFVRAWDLNAQAERKRMARGGIYDRAMIGNLLLLGWKADDIKPLYPPAPDFFRYAIKPLMTNNSFGQVIRKIYYGDSEISPDLLEKVLERKNEGEKNPNKVQRWTNRKWAVGYGNRFIWVQGKKIRF